MAFFTMTLERQLQMFAHSGICSSPAGQQRLCWHRKFADLNMAPLAHVRRRRPEAFHSEVLPNFATSSAASSFDSCSRGQATSSGPFMRSKNWERQNHNCRRWRRSTTKQTTFQTPAAILGVVNSQSVRRSLFKTGHLLGNCAGRSTTERTTS